MKKYKKMARKMNKTNKQDNNGPGVYIMEIGCRKQ